MKFMYWLACCAVAGGALPSVARAQQLVALGTIAAPSLRTAVDSAWQRAVSSTEARGLISRALAERVVARSPWAAPPSLELSHRDERVIGGTGGRESEIGIAWPMWLPGQRTARGRNAEAQVVAAHAAERVSRLRIAGEVRAAAWEIASGRAELRLAEAEVQTLDALAGDVARRIDAGDLARADGLAARSELLAATTAAAEGRQRLHAAETRWGVLTGVAPLPDPHEAPPPDKGESEHPELALAALNVERASSHLDLVRVSPRDPPELMLRLRDESGATGAGSQQSVGVAVRLPFGTAGRNVPRQVAASTELDLAHAEERRLRDLLHAQTSTSRSSLAFAEQRVSTERSRAALLRERADLIDKSFRAGESALPELLRALGAAAQADAAHARARTAAGLARAQLHQSLGLLP